jgi:site-specific recombinase XerD
MKVTENNITAYIEHLRREERAGATVEKYARELRALSGYLGGEHATQELVVAYKQRLAEDHAPTSVNSALAAINGFFAFYDRPIKVKPMKIQRKTFIEESRELTKAEYKRLLYAAKKRSNERLNLVMQAICSTGIRVSELRYITVEAVRDGRAVVTNKGKTRTIFIPQKLKPILLAYARRLGIDSGCIFVTKRGKPLDRRSVWLDMKSLCESAEVAPTKVFPHNLRHLFARVFYSIEKDIIRLADILGHSDIKTTRIYVMETGLEHRRRVDALGLVT